MTTSRPGVRVWLPSLVANSGTDIYTRRLAYGLTAAGIEANITWLPGHYQFYPWLLGCLESPRGTTVIHCNSWNGFAFARCGHALVVTEHQGAAGSDARPYNSKMQYAYHRFWIRRHVLASLRCAHAVTCVSRFAANTLSAQTGHHSVHAIPNFVDTAIFAPKNVFRPGPRPFRLLYIGNLSYLKGADMLPAILARLGSGFELWYTSGLKDTNTIQPGNSMINIGRLNSEEALVAAYRECDAVLVPSRFEGFGYTVLEAMACEKPVIASRAGAIPEVLGDKAGILCDIGNVDEFAAACMHLAENPALCRDMGAAGRSRAVTNFSAATIVPRYIQLYESLL